MRKSLVVGVLAVLLALPTFVGLPHEAPADGQPWDEAQVGPRITAPNLAEVSEIFRGLQGFFTENLGLVDNPEVRFYAQGDALSVGFTLDGLILLLSDDRTSDGTSTGEGPSETYVLKLSFEDDRSVEPVGFHAVPHLTNSFVGNDASKWVRGARSFEEVRYEGLYEGIDLRFHFKDGRLKYDFILASWADPGSVRMRYDGATGLRADPETGDMLVSTPMCTLRDERPVILWEAAGMARSCPGDFALGGNGSWGFALPEGVPRGVPMTIDPGLAWSTFLGGSGRDTLYSVAVDKDGSVYAVGQTDSINYPTTSGAYDRTQNQYKGLVTKLDPSGSTILFSTFFGGTNSTVPGGSTVTQSAGMTPDGNLALASITYCDDCPTTPDAIYATHRGRADIYFLVLNPQGSDLVYASYLGGSDRDVAHDLVIDDEGAVVIVGETSSPDWTVPPNTYCSTYNGVNDVFVLKLSPTYHEIRAMTYLGGTSNDMSYQTDVDSDQNIVVTGGTFSTDFPTTPGAYCTTHAGYLDSFLTKFDPNCTRLIFSTMYGGTGQDDGCRLRVCGDGRIWVGAETTSPDYPVTPDAQYDSFSGDVDPGISVFDATGSRLLYSTYFPGTRYESVYGSAIDEKTNQIYFYTRSSSTVLPTTKGCYCPVYSGGSNDLLVVGFNLTTYKFDYCTYIGGSGVDNVDLSWGDTMMVDDEGYLYLAGTTASTDFPTTGQAATRAYAGGTFDGFVLKLDPRPIQDPPEKPTGLVSRPGNNQVEVMWDSPTAENYKVHKYQVFRSPRDRLGPDAIKWLVTKGTSYKDMTVQNGKTYYYWVSAFNSVGEGALAGPVDGRPMGSPSAPQNLVAQSGNGRVTLTWTPPATMSGGQLLGYVVLKGGNSHELVQHALIGADDRWEDTEVELGKTYFYSLKAFNEIFSGEQSSIVGIKARDRASAPLKVSLVPIDRGALISWQPPFSNGGATILGYHILRGPSEESMEIVGITSPSERSLPNYGLTNGVEYNYSVAAFTEVGMGYPSEPLTVKPTGTPSEPRNFIAMRGDGSVRLIWDSPANDGGWPVTGYKVYAGKEILVEIESNLNATYYLHTGLTNGDPWYYSISAMNRLGAGPKSNISFAVPLGQSEAPASFIVEPMRGMVRLSWYTPLDTGGAPLFEYRIYRAMTDSPFEYLKGLATTALNYWDYEIVNGRTYKYYIVAVTEMGEGRSTSIESAIPYGSPGRPSGLFLEAGDRRVTLHWTAPENDGGRAVEGYSIFRGLSPQSMVELLKVTPQETYTDMSTELTNGVDYYYSIRALNEAGEGPESDVMTARPAGVPGVVSDFAVTSETGTIILTWKPPAIGGGRSVIGYVIYRGRTISGMVAYRTLGTALSFLDLDVELGESYFYSVSAVNTEGEGDIATPRLIDVPPRMSGGWTGESALYWVLVIVVLSVMTLMVIVVLVRNRFTRPPSRHGSSKEKSANRTGGKADGRGGGR